MTTITCYFERGQEKQEIELALTLRKPRKMLKAMKKLKKAESDGWRLVDASGGDPKIVDFIKRQIIDYDRLGSAYKVPIKETVSLGSSIAKDQGTRQGKSIKKRIKGVFSRTEKQETS